MYHIKKLKLLLNLMGKKNRKYILFIHFRSIKYHEEKLA